MAIVTFHGVRGSCPCSDPRMRRYGGATACVSVQPRADVPPIVLDLGTGSRNLGEELVERYFHGEGVPAGAPAGHADDSPDRVFDRRLELSVFVSHLHFDHVQGLPFFGPALRYGSSIDIYGPVQDAGTLEEAFQAFVQPPYFPVGLDALPASLRMHGLDDGATVEVGDARVTGRSIPHNGRTLGYRIECDGQIVAYLGDHQAPKPGHTGPRVSPAALELVRDADVLIHDAQYSQQEFGVKAHWGHSTVEFALEIARAGAVRKLVLFHHDPTHDDATLDHFGREAECLALKTGLDVEVLVAAEGLAIKLDH